MSRKTLGTTGRNAIPKTFDRAALRSDIASVRFPGVLCDRNFRSTEGTLGTPAQTTQIPLCLPHARGHHLAETRYLSEVQNETG